MLSSAPKRKRAIALMPKDLAARPTSAIDESGQIMAGSAAQSHCDLGKVGDMVLANVLAAIGLLIGVFSIVYGASLGVIGLAILLAVLAIFVQSGVYFRVVQEGLSELIELLRRTV